MQILTKTSGRSANQARVHLHNPNSRHYYGAQYHAGSVCYAHISPDWDGWELRDGTLSDVTCKKCQRWASTAHKHEFLWIAWLFGWQLRDSMPKKKRPGERALRDRERWKRWTGEQYPHSEATT